MKAGNNVNSMNPREGKKDLIVEAGIRVFSQKGYHYTKMEEIAVEAGIGKGTIYEYFSSKLQLLQEIMQRSFHLYERSLADDKTNALTVEGRIKALIEGHFRFCQGNKELTRIIFWDTDTMDKELREWACQKRAQKEQRLQVFLEEAMTLGEIREFDPRLLTIIIGGVLGSIWMPVVIDGWVIDAAIAAQQITDIIMNGIRK